MKSLRRSVILIIFLLVSVASMATGVFAWFIDYGNRANVDYFEGSLMGNEDVLEVDAETEGIFLGDRIRDLVYLNDSDFNDTSFNFYGYASVLEIIITNPGLTSVNVNLQLNVVAAPEFGVYAGNQAGLKYLVLEEHPTLTQSVYMANRFQYFQSTGSVFTAMNQHNLAGFSLQGESSIRVYIYVWGAYDGLTTAQKSVYHALVYRVKVMV